MFLKVIKNNLINSWRDFVNVYLASLIATLIIMLSVTLNISSNVPVLAALFMFLFVGLFIAAIVLIIRANLRIMYSSLYSIDPVLTWTQPVPSYLVLLGKLLTSLIWNVISSVYFMFLGYILLNYILNQAGSSLDVLGSAMGLFLSFDSAVLPIYLVSLISDFAFMGSLILLVGAFVNSSYIRSRKVLIAIVSFFVVQFFVNQLVTLIAPNGIFTLNQFYNNTYGINGLNIEMYGSIFNVVLYFAVYFAFSAIFFFLATRLIDRKLEI